MRFNRNVEKSLSDLEEVDQREKYGHRKIIMICLLWWARCFNIWTIFMSYIFITPFFIFPVGFEFESHPSPLRLTKDTKRINILSIFRSGISFYKATYQTYCFFYRMAWWYFAMAKWKTSNEEASRSSQRIHEKLLFEFSKCSCFFHFRFKYSMPMMTMICIRFHSPNENCRRKRGERKIKSVLYKVKDMLLLLVQKGGNGRTRSNMRIARPFDLYIRAL